MADVFISYSREDRDLICELATVLVESGLSVWWDKQISAGTEFSKETAAELDSARVVLVAWSKASITSYWVADEAAEGRASGRLVPINLDGSIPPLGFRQFQTIDFHPWLGGDAAPLADLSDAIAARLNGPVRLITSTRTAKGRLSLSRRGVAIGAVTLAAGGFGTLVLLGQNSIGPLTGLLQRREGRKSRYESIAVLPFSDLSEKQDKQWFADGIAEDILSALSSNKGLKVAARTSSFLFDDGKAKPQQIAAALNVETILEGSVRLSADMLRIAAKLIDAETGFQLWASSFDRKFNDLFAVQDEISASIVRELDASLRSAPSSGRPQSLQAYEHFLSAKSHAEQRSPESLRLAREEFGKVIALEPSFAPAYALLADTSWRSSLLDHGDLPHDQATTLAKTNLEKAYALDPKSVEARVVDVSLKTLNGIQGVIAPSGLIEAEEIAREVIEDAPNYLPAYHEIVFNLQAQAKASEALKFAELAISFDPIGAISGSKLANALRFAGRSKEAVDVASRAFAYNKGFNLLAFALAYAHSELGDATRATEVFFPLLESAPDDYAIRDMVSGLLAFMYFEEEALTIAPNDVLRDAALVRMGKSFIPAASPARTEQGGDIVDGVMHHAKRQFREAIGPLAKASDPKSIAEGPLIAKLAHSYRSIGATPAADQQLQELDRLIDKMEAGGLANSFYFDAKTLSRALRGDADELFGSKELEQYLVSSNPFRPPFEFDPIFETFKTDSRFAEAVVKENDHRRRERLKFLALGGVEKIQAAISRNKG